MPSTTDTIVALATGSLPSAIAILRFSGPKSINILQKYTKFLPISGSLSPCLIVDPETGQMIDAGMAVFFASPKSFTGEDCLEFHVHGSQAVVKRLLNLVTAIPGVRLAEAGEFSRRAFENGKLDMVTVEGLGDLIAAETEGQRSLAIGRMKGGINAALNRWRQELVAALVVLEAQLDFSDESDVSSFDNSGFESRLLTLAAEFEQALTTYAHGQLVREGFRIGLGGPPNVGKSSLLNRLAHSEVAIVTEEAGTTRDINEVSMEIAGQLVIVSDSAGLRKTAGLAEAEGIRRARVMLEQCNLVLWVSSIDAPEVMDYPVSESDVIKIANKCDLGLPKNYDLAISCKTGEGLEQLVNLLQERVAEQRGESAGGVMLSRLRDKIAMKEALECMHRARLLLRNDRELRAIADVSIELLVEELRQGLYCLRRLLGEVDAEDVLDALFSGFCIGK